MSTPALRPALAGMLPYGAPQVDVAVRLNVNENPFPPPKKVRQQLSEAVYAASAELNRYPDREASELRAALARYLGFGLGAEHVWAANGSNEALIQLLGAFGGPGRTLLTFTPTYSMYPEYARDTNTAYVTVPRRADFTLDAELVLRAIEQHHADAIIITTPNNPTGTLTPTAVIDEICARTGALVIVDEAYQEFAEYPEDSSLALLPKYQHLVVARTMSKAFALAGARIGYLAAAPALIDAVRIARLPYHLSTPTQVIGRVALENAAVLLDKVNLLRATAQTLQPWLRNQGLEVVPSQANFVLFGRFVDRHAAWAALLERGVLIREVGPEGFLRVSMGTAAEVRAFKEALCEVLDTPAGRLIKPRSRSSHEPSGPGSTQDR